MKNYSYTSIFFLNIYSVHVIAISLSLFLYSGCASNPVKSFPILDVAKGGTRIEWPDSQCEKRFRQYWSNRFSGDIEGGYNMESPDFREIVSLQKYKYYVQNAVKNQLLNMEIRQIVKESDFVIAIDCLARIEAGNGEQMEVSMMDRWVLTSGSWYHMIKDPLIFSL